MLKGGMDIMMQTSIPTTIQSNREEDGGIDLRSSLNFFRRHWLVISGVAALILLLTLVVTLSLTPRYMASAQILLDSGKENVLGADAMMSELSLDSSAVDSQVSVIQSRALLRRVVENEGLVSDEEFGSTSTPGVLARLKSLISVPQAVEEDVVQEGSVNRSTLASINALQRALMVVREGRTYVLTITVTSIDRDRAARLANAIADAFLVDQLEARYESARRASQWLSERLEQLRGELRTSEDTVESFRRANNLVAAGTGTLNDQQLSELNAKLVAARTDAAEKKARLDQAQNIVSTKGNIQAVPDVMRSPVIQNLRGQQADVSRREADLVARYGDRHPSVINVRAERRDVERAINGESDRIVSNLRNDHSVSVAAADALERNLRGLTGQTGVGNDIALKLRELERNAAANRTLYENFLSRAKLSEDQGALATREARIISQASVPGGASFPKKSLMASFGLILGLSAGVGCAVAMEALRRGFSSANQIEKMLGLPTLSSVPQLTQAELALGATKTPGAYLLKKPLSRFSESIRAIRAGIEMADVDNPAKVVQITSSVPMEGKSTIAVSLALSAAASGANVLLIDADLRHPTTTKTFRLTDRPGLVDLLTGFQNHDLIVFDEATGLHVLGAGSETQAPADLLTSTRMRSFLIGARANFDYVVLDTPPAGPVIDAAALSQAVDKVVFVVAWESTPRELVAHSLRKFAHQKVAGIVLSRVDLSARGRHGRDYYDQEYFGNYYSG